MTATPYEILAFIGRGDSLRDDDRLKAALDRLQATTIATSIRQPTGRRRRRFSWINEWKERLDANGRPRGIELILPEVLRRRHERRLRAHHRPRLFRSDGRIGALALSPGAQGGRQ
ncbi:hypothetical protein MPC4_290009 [Methylocella tundrae]|nr:hypothetical protein MPC4_290009 [Methylocella tundrae]